MKLDYRMKLTWDEIKEAASIFEHYSNRGDFIEKIVNTFPEVLPTEACLLWQAFDYAEDVFISKYKAHNIE